MNSKKFIIMLSCLTAAFCVLIVVYNFASMPPYGTEASSAVALYASASKQSQAADEVRSVSESGSSAQNDDADDLGGVSAGTSSKSKKGSSKTSSTKTPAGSSASGASSGSKPAAAVTDASAEKKGTSSSSKATPQSPVNINTAGLAELDSIPYIGPTKAQAIIDYRSQNGNFTSVDGLDNVKGIGAKTIDKIRQYITVG